MDGIRRWFRDGVRTRRANSYQAIPGTDPVVSPSAPNFADRPGKSSAFEYAVFCLLGCAMLWSWNMFMACATYFQGRFAESDFILNHFQSFIIAVSTVTNLITVLFLLYRQAEANYPYRISVSLILNCVVFTILALSTAVSPVSPSAYLVFVLVCVLFASLSTGFSQNGIFAFVSRFGSVYTQAIMTGQGVAGVLPAIAQIFSVLAFQDHDDIQPGRASPRSAFVYFMTATAVSGTCMLCFICLLARHQIKLRFRRQATSSNHRMEKQVVSLWYLLKKLRWIAFAVWLDFCVTMAFPIFTQAIVSVQSDAPGRLYQPDIFIPLGFLLWNLGDLGGRLVCAWPQLTSRRPHILALAAAARLVFIPLYYSCNFKGHGAVIKSDLFYWLIQLLFGFTNGWIGSCAMMVAPEFVDDKEKEACGGFMGFCLVAGLTFGSLLSFAL